MIIPIVEGDGEKDAVPILLKNWFKFRRFFNFHTTDEAVFAPQSAMIAPYDAERENGIEHYVRRARAARPDAILVILDSDKECIQRRGKPADQQLGPELTRRAQAAADGIPVEVVVANREYEAWFLAGYRRLKQRGVFHTQVKFRDGYDVEEPGGSKRKVSECMATTKPYSPTAHQPQLTAALGFGSYMAGYSPSYGKLLSRLERITQQARRNRRARR
ncbi:DUF4276 family protein [Rubripirellula lacrimiformis]|uniref:DUF4276 family protein n=1 Tax=Rubripirellula lacrimiformis TaxID=1930273 RepID=UPI001C54F4E5|nr:DUF4276 family protein [Rubripirellula lacrimiformis]